MSNQFLSLEPLPLEFLIRVATADALLWLSLLFISGGLLELPKCSVHVSFTTFYPHGRPRLCKHSEIPSIAIPDPRHGSNIDIRCNPHTLEHKTLGHYKAPAGIFPRQRAALTQSADTLATMVLKSFLTPLEARMVYFAIFLAKFSYVLPQCYLLPSVLRKIEAKAQQAFTAKLGFNRKMSCAIQYGPPALGGVGLVRLETIQGRPQVVNFIKHWRPYTYVGSLLRCTLAWVQMNSGISTPLLMTPSLRLPHFESKFLQSLRQYLARIDAVIEVDDPFVPPCQREHDVYPMEFAVSANTYSTWELQAINYCRLYLQAVTASNIVSPEHLGLHVDPRFLCGHLGPLSSVSSYCPTNQARPSQSSWKIWAHFCALLETHLQLHPLGAWTVPGGDLRRHWACYFDHTSHSVFRLAGSIGDSSLFYDLCMSMSPAAVDVFLVTTPAAPWHPTPTSVPVLSSDLTSGSAMLDGVTIVGGIAPTVAPAPSDRPLCSITICNPFLSRFNNCCRILTLVFRWLNCSVS